MLSTKTQLALAGSYGLMGIFMGTWSAHGLPAETSESDVLNFRFAAHYQMISGAVMIGLAALQRTLKGNSLAETNVSRAFKLISLGVALFSGMTYASILKYKKIRGMAIIQIGIASFTIGWAYLALAASHIK